MPNPDIENPIPNSLRGTVLCTGIERGGVAHWDFLWQVIILLKGISQRSLSFCHICETQSHTVQRLSSSIFTCLFVRLSVRPHGDISIYLHCMMF